VSRATPSAYYAEIQAADEDLQDALGHVRAEQDAGRITTADAAQERLGLLERHLQRCQRLRREYLGTSAVPGTEAGGCSV
jgi:hypothetical protein